MANKNIKEVEGGEVTTLNDTDGVEIDTGSSSVWIQIVNLALQILTRLAVATWSPTWTNLSVGNGVLTDGYSQIGKLVLGHLELVFGTTTAISGDVSFSPPVTQGTYGAISAPVGLVRMLSGGAGFTGIVLATNTTTFRITVAKTDATYLSNVSLSSIVPGTWTTADVIQVFFVYFAP